jgi:hypothetical protein
MGAQPIRRREPSRKVSVASAPKEGNDTAKLRLTKLNAPADRPGRTRRNLRVSMALIDPKPLTRRSIAEMLAKAPIRPGNKQARLRRSLARNCFLAERDEDRPVQRVGQEQRQVLRVRRQGLPDWPFRKRVCSGGFPGPTF